ncbi:hypothetical protein [Nocardia cyriacigeorgica]|uniref:hypothetical protein n=1 Tax=Nocardia cyriacigeorgica TaxID=135487 RepID=UPI0024557502|nr:hypothetical protein [Nocardia cyriacigeorgica]
MEVPAHHGDLGAALGQRGLHRRRGRDLTGRPGRRGGGDQTVDPPCQVDSEREHHAQPLLGVVGRTLRLIGQGVHILAEPGRVLPIGTQRRTQVLGQLADRVLLLQQAGEIGRMVVQFRTAGTQLVGKSAHPGNVGAGEFAAEHHQLDRSPQETGQSLEGSAQLHDRAEQRTVHRYDLLRSRRRRDQDRMQQPRLNTGLLAVLDHLRERDAESLVHIEFGLRRHARGQLGTPGPVAANHLGESGARTRQGAQVFRDQGALRLPPSTSATGSVESPTECPQSGRIDFRWCRHARLTGAVCSRRLAVGGRRCGLGRFGRPLCGGTVERYRPGTVRRCRPGIIRGVRRRAIPPHRTELATELGDRDDLKHDHRIVGQDPVHGGHELLYRREPEIGSIETGYLNSMPLGQRTCQPFDLQRLMAVASITVARLFIGSCVRSLCGTVPRIRPGVRWSRSVSGGARPGLAGRAGRLFGPRCPGPPRGSCHAAAGRRTRGSGTGPGRGRR